MAGHNFTRVHIPPKRLVAVAAPSGAGKSSIVKKLLKHKPEFSFSVSCTTRAPRDGEQNGREYYFISVEEFKRKIAAGEFAEYEEVYPNQFYGTLKSEIERIWSLRKVALFDIDVKGALNLKQQYGENCLTIFIAPPDEKSLETRLRNRMTESKDSLKERLKRSKEELSMQTRFDRVVVNADFDTAFMRVKNHVTNFLKPATVHIH